MKEGWGRTVSTLLHMWGAVVHAAAVVSFVTQLVAASV